MTRSKGFRPPLLTPRWKADVAKFWRCCDARARGKLADACALLIEWRIPGWNMQLRMYYSQQQLGKFACALSYKAFFSTPVAMSPAMCLAS